MRHRLLVLASCLLTGLVVAGMLAWLCRTGLEWLLIQSNHPDPSDVARRAKAHGVKVGDPRDGVLLAFSDAWYRTNPIGLGMEYYEDWFFYGARDLAWAEVISVEYVRDNSGRYVVEQISYVPNWQVAGSRKGKQDGGCGCMPSELFDASRPIPPTPTAYYLPPLP